MHEKYTPPTPEEVQAAFKADVDDAVSFMESEIAPAMAEATDLYNAEPFGDEEEGRSQVVKPVVRDTVRATLPSLMRVFFGGNRVMDFTGTTDMSPKYAEEMTSAVEAVFMRHNPGFKIAYSAFKDALVRKIGWFFWDWDDRIDVRGRTYRGVSEEQLMALQAELGENEEVKVLDQEQVGEIPAAPAAVDPMTGETIQPAMPPQPIYEYTVTLISRNKRDRVIVECVPPEEVIISKDARDPYNCRLIGRRCYKTRGELVSMGIDPELIDEACGGSSGQSSIESNPMALARSISGDEGESTEITGDQQKYVFVDAFYRVDEDGDGISELRRKQAIGDDLVEVFNDYADEVQLAAICPDPEPHTWLGLSQTDTVADLQVIGSHVVRDTLDSLKASIFPRMKYVEGQVNADDVLNTEIGAAIRTRRIDAVEAMAVPFLGAQAFPVLEWLDGEREMRTGQSRNSMGIDPRALQSTNQIAVTQAVTAAQSQPELIARIFAETGMTRLFRGIAKLIFENQKGTLRVLINGALREVDPKKWDIDTELQVDTGLGVGSTDSKIGVLNGVAASQTMALRELGLENPLCSLQELYHTQSMILRLSGFRDVNTYWRNPAYAEETLEEQEPQPTPEQVLAEAQMKIEAGKLANDRLDMILKDDRERDKNEADAFLRAAEIRAKYGTQVDMNALKMIIERQRIQATEKQNMEKLALEKISRAAKKAAKK